jgi:hypothetical protein
MRGVITEVCYNVQSTIDAENAIDIIGNNTFNFVLDKGYYTAEQIHKSQKWVL